MMKNLEVRRGQRRGSRSPRTTLAVLTAMVVGLLVSGVVVAAPSEASNGRHLTVCNRLPVDYTKQSQARVSSAGDLPGGRTCIDVLWAPKPSQPGTYYGKITWANDSKDYARYPIAIYETLTISTSGRCSSSYKVDYNGPGGSFNYTPSSGCQLDSGAQVSIG